MHSVFKQIQLEIASNSFENSKSFQSRLSLKQNLLKKLCQMNFHVMDRLETSVVMVVGVPGHIDVPLQGVVLGSPHGMLSYLKWLWKVRGVGSCSTLTSGTCD